MTAYIPTKLGFVSREFVYETFSDDVVTAEKPFGNIDNLRGTFPDRLFQAGKLSSNPIRSFECKKKPKDSA